MGDFQAPSKEYLSFKRGNVIRVFDKKDVEPGCLWGVLGDYRGKFPTGLVEEADVRLRELIDLFRVFFFYNPVSDFFRGFFNV